MGTIVTKLGADYRNNHIGYFDNAVKVFRKKLPNGTYERNKLNEWGGHDSGAVGVSIPNIVHLNFDLACRANNTAGMVFSVADWTNYRVIFVKVAANAVMRIEALDFHGDPTSTANAFFTDAVVVLGQHNIINVVLDFNRYEIPILTNSTTEYPSYNVTSEGFTKQVFDLDQPKYGVSIGQFAPDVDASTQGGAIVNTILVANASRATMSSILAEDYESGVCLFNFDFLGYTDEVKLTDKLREFKLSHFGTINSFDADNITL